ncbi:MAG: type II toxin-antitoxin system HicB family antitoxin [Chloroflexi bacterium]|nr:type II toxin-antitoxin system HicB family antitoxin [Chloroflexota bacterium]
MKREFTVVIERDEDGYFVGTVPELKACHTQARSLDELMERMKEAALLCLEAEDRPAEGELSLSKILRDTDISREDFLKLL